MCRMIYIYETNGKFKVVEHISYTQTYCTMCLCCDYPPSDKEEIVAEFDNFDDAYDFVARRYGIVDDP